MNPLDFKNKDFMDNLRKIFIIISMIVVGILLIAYKVDPSNWTDRFGTYTTIVVAISAILAIVGLLLMIIDIKRFIRHEILGFILGIVAAIVLLLYPSSPALDIDISSGTGNALIAFGTILAILDGIILARSGGFLSPCIIGLGFQIVFAGYYPMMNPDATSFHPNTFLASNIGVGFILLSFILMIYHDLKFFFLIQMIKNANKLRREKKFEEALKYCDRALLIYPYFVTGLNNKGNILFNLKRPNEAIVYYNKAIKINPNYVQAQNNLQVVQKKMGRALGQ